MTSATPVILPQLPNELLEAVFALLDGDDVKNLRATCSAMAEVIPLSFDRVFISANSLNLKVFRAIADDETIRHQVTEIVWDDARLSTGPELGEERMEYEEDGVDPDDAVTDNGCPFWFEKGRSDYGNPGTFILPDYLMGIKESWAYYEPLLEDQRQVLATDADIEAFKYGLQRFPSLKRVTITPSAHGRIRNPLYKTPMIRAFPRGFDYPVPTGWPSYATELPGPVDVLPWVSEDDSPCQEMYGPDCTVEAYRAKWRGYRVVIRALAEHDDHHITELYIGGNEVESGLNCRIFDQRCVEYDDLVTLLARPGFRYLNLDLFTGLLEREDWESYKSGLLHDALAQAKDLEHICFRSTMEITGGSSEQLDWEKIENYVFPLRTIFPVDQWPRLRHFGISHMLVQLDDLMELLSALPRTLRSVELSNLAWGSLTHRTRELLPSMRDVLDWRSRPVEERPKVHMIVSGAACGDGDKDGWYVEIDDLVYSFLYGEGKNPLSEHPDIIYTWEGGVRRDIFNPGFRVPHTNNNFFLVTM
ncbi:F-box domain-containing protein [Fusarium acuminatum]|uniref:F-box domain-containing protein n=1 Tax=Fusarium acuminatum TaxID=5515 RepID=A0ABZ2WP27_9HYPO